jgi:hypothetical protein
MVLPLGGWARDELLLAVKKLLRNITGFIWLKIRTTGVILRTR